MGYNAGGGTWADAASSYNVGIGNYVMDGALNGATYNTALGHQALTSITTGDYNVGLGYLALGNSTTAGTNVAVGGYAGASITTGGNNVSIGYTSLNTVTVGTDNIAIGKDSGRYTTGSYNTFVGSEAGKDNTSGVNTAIGSASLKATTTGSQNTAIGQNALTAVTVASRNTAIGTGAMASIPAGVAIVNNVAIGNSAMNGSSSTTGNTYNNVSIGYQSMYSALSAINNVMVGNIAGASITNGYQNVGVGSNALNDVTTGSNNVAIGTYALDAITTTGNTVAVGHSALTALTSGASNTAIGYEAGKTITTGQRNIAIGYEAMHDTDAGSTSSDSDNNIFIGYTAGGGAWADAKSENNVAIGSNVMQGVLNEANNNTALGYFALASITSGDSNVGIGAEAGGSLSASIKNTILGYQAGSSISHVSASDNVLIGNASGKGGTGELKRCIVIGSQAMDSTTDQAQTGTIAIGHATLSSLTSGSGNTAVGYSSLGGLTTGSQNTFLGYGSGDTFIGDHSVGIGYHALKGSGSNTNNYNTAIGSRAMDAVTTGSSNVAVGMDSLGGITTGNDNVAIGKNSLPVLVEGIRNVAIGTASLQSENTYGYNTAVGYHALGALNANANGYNTAIGYSSGNGITTGIQNTSLGASTVFDVDANNQTAIGYGATTDSANDIAIGNTSVDEVKGQVDFSTFSDKRIKTDIKDSDLGLSFINELKVRKFKKVNPAKYPDEIRKENDGKDVEGNEFEWTDAQANKVWDGLIAQEVKEAMDKVGTTFSGWNEESNSKQLVTYSTMVMPLIKSVQELSAEIDKLKRQLEDK